MVFTKYLIIFLSRERDRAIFGGRCYLPVDPCLTDSIPVAGSAEARGVHIISQIIGGKKLLRRSYYWS